MVNREEIQEEQLRMTRVRRIVDVTAYWLAHELFSREEALSIIEHARGEILKLCPDKEDVFELVLRPRFLRLFRERVLTEWGVADSSN